MRANFREAFVITPRDEIILVGRSVGSELSKLRRAALKLTTIGAIILSLGLAGG
jgi:hypothetical protein